MKLKIGLLVLTKKAISVIPHLMVKEKLLSSSKIEKFLELVDTKCRRLIFSFNKRLTIIILKTA